MAAKKKTTKKKTAAKTQQQQPRKQKQQREKRPIRREIWSIVCLLFAVLSILGCTDGCCKQSIQGSLGRWLCHSAVFASLVLYDIGVP